MELEQRRSLWLKHIKNWQQSDMKQAAFCKANGLNQQAFSNWKRRLRGHFPDFPRITSLTAEPPTLILPLVAVKITDDLSETSHRTKAIIPAPLHSAPSCTEATSGIRLLVDEKYQILFYNDFDNATLKRLLAVLAEV